MFSSFSPDLDVNPKFVRSNSTVALERLVKLRKARMLESFYGEAANFSHLSLVFSWNITKFFRTFSQSISRRPPLTFP